LFVCLFACFLCGAGFAPLHTAVKRPENREAIDLLVHVRVAALSKIRIIASYL
jgi:hypothetical protein